MTFIHRGDSIYFIYIFQLSCIPSSPGLGFELNVIYHYTDHIRSVHPKKVLFCSPMVENRIYNVKVMDLILGNILIKCMMIHCETSYACC